MSREIRSLEYDSRQVRKGSLFFAVEGEVWDGHDFIPEALSRGAVGVVSRHPIQAGPAPAVWIEVQEIREAMALMANEFYGHPSRQLPLIGITGTNGKTTTAYLAHSILSCRGPALMMGTISNHIGRLEVPAVRTTPEAIDIQKTLRRALEARCRTGVLEVSSHALALRRVYDCEFPVAVFTNLSREHLDFHQSMENYFQSKALLYDPAYNPGLQCAVIGGDDPYCRRLKTPGGIRRLTFGLESSNDSHPLRFRQSVEGSEASLKILGEMVEVRTPLVGRHNLLNILAAATASRCLGSSIQDVVQGIEAVARIPGRFERVEVSADFAVFVDYAHTPDALQNLLLLAREICEGRLICVFGCGGDRDASKRPAMGRIAGRLSDLPVLTSDNPRNEDPNRILDQIEAGLEPPSGHLRIADRRQAIARALAEARPGDVIVIAGKGHETYQEIDGEKIDFDDREVVREVL